MPCTTFALDPAFGPVTEIGISVARSQLPQNSPTPPITWIKAIADTGCSTTSIFSGVASKAGLKVVSKTNVISTTHTVPANVYLGDLWIRATYIGGNHEFPLYDRQFIELIQANPNFDALLGMDVFFWSSLIVGAVAILFALKNLSHLGDFNDAPRNDRLCGVLTAGWKRLRAGLRRAGRQD